MTLLIEFVALAAILGILAIAMKARGEEQDESAPIDSAPHGTP